MDSNQQTHVLPFLKWAGGKRWLTSSARDEFPVAFDRFVEPFLGSGAVYFHLQPKKALLADINQDLITTYQAIALDPNEVERKLRAHQRRHSKSYYYSLRNKSLRSPTSIAARFIYLNRTCWNGLYRVNLDGKFNVPIGTKTNVLLSTDDFHAVSTLLKRAKIASQDFKMTFRAAKQGDFFFVDPPYTVNHNHNGFLKYNEKLFSWEDQMALRDCLIRLDSIGAKFLMTHANHSSVRELFGQHFDFRTIVRSSVIAGKKSFRGPTEELIIKNY